MTRYRVSGLHRDTGVSLSIAVDARDPEHARELAAQQSVISDNVIEIGPTPLISAPTSGSFTLPPQHPSPSRPIEWAPSNRDRQARRDWIDDANSTPIAAYVCGVVAVLLYLSAVGAWLVLLSALGAKEGVQSFPLAQLALALALTAAGAVLHALATLLRLAHRILHHLKPHPH